MTLHKWGSHMLPVVYIVFHAHTLLHILFSMYIAIMNVLCFNEICFKHCYLVIGYSGALMVNFPFCCYNGGAPKGGCKRLIQLRNLLLHFPERCVEGNDSGSVEGTTGCQKTWFSHRLVFSHQKWWFPVICCA